MKPSRSHLTTPFFFNRKTLALERITKLENKYKKFGTGENLQVEKDIIKNLGLEKIFEFGKII